MRNLGIAKSLLLLVFLLTLSVSHAQVGQIAIGRVEQMPNLPQPYLMRDWRKVALQYDNFIYDLSKSGEHLPLAAIKSSGYNDPSIEPILLDTYVGTSSSTQAEAINIIPSLVGASLIGIDKSNQNGINWVEKAKDFFNSKNSQFVYLNGYNANSGSDWWYDLMPNVFFYQLSALYNDSDFDSQFVSVADQWLEAVNAMGAAQTPWSVPDMNYRAWRLSTMTGNANGVHEPEAAGAIAWLLYHAYYKTGEEKYLTGAEHALEFLSSLTTNPSYELQLPYGTLTAAKLNALFGTNYDVQKMINWSFDRGSLRGWGTIVGTWDGKDVSGLIGEANDSGNDYAFLMNGYQQAAALAPLVKYDKRYARDISKWILNLANASRLLYPKYLDPAKQDDYSWSAEHDPESVIAYEALKENWEGKALYGTGDAKRSGWAETNLALYGSSHVGYLAAIIDTTNVEGILRLNLDATDFFADKRYPSYAIYNPHPTTKSVAMTLGNSSVDIYEAISEEVIANGVSGEHNININAGEVVLVTFIPANATLTTQDNKLMYGDFVVDYHYGYNFAPRLRIKSLASERALYEFNEQINVYASIDHLSETSSFSWFVNGVLAETGASSDWQWIAPEEEGSYIIRVEVTSAGETVSSEMPIDVVAVVPQAPAIDTLQFDKIFYYENETAEIICKVIASEGQSISYNWDVSGGTFEQNDSLALWVFGQEGLYTITCTATNIHGLSSSRTVEVLVKNDTGPEVDPLAFLPLNVNTNDYSGNDFHATVSGTTKAVDANGAENSAVRIATSDDQLYVPNTPALNFVDEITVACWIKISATGREAFVLSHGSWEERWKMSVTPNLKLRWTVKTAEGVKDLDSREAISPGQFYHVTASYSGYSLELYIDGLLDSYTRHGGPMLTTSKAISFGQKSVDETEYFLNGTIDEVRIYNHALQPWQIVGLKDIWVKEPTTGLNNQREALTLFPNPVGSSEVWLNVPVQLVKGITITRMDGRRFDPWFEGDSDRTRINLDDAGKGIMIIEIRLSSEIRHLKLVIQ